MLDTRSLTTGEKEGSGIFDELMRTVKSHVQLELTEGRITEQAYAQLYLGALQYVLQTSSQYALQYEMTNKEIELTNEKIISSKKQNELIELQKTQMTIANDTATYNLEQILPKQLLQMTAEIAQIEAKTALIEGQLTSEAAKTALTENQTLLVDEQIRSEADKYTLPTGGLNLAAYNKTLAEIDILEAKATTENKQTVGTRTDTGGLIGAEMELKYNQANSFLRDAEQKAAKIFSDSYAMTQSITTNEEPGTWGLGSTDSSSVMAKLKSGI